MAKEEVLCSYCRVKCRTWAKLVDHKWKAHRLLERECKTPGEEHGPLQVLIFDGLIYLAVKGSPALPKQVPEFGWNRHTVPKEVKWVVQADNKAPYALELDGGYTPLNPTSLQAIDILYHNLAREMAAQRPDERYGTRVEGVVRPSDVTGAAMASVPRLIALPEMASKPSSAGLCKSCKAPVDGSVCANCGAICS